MGLGAFASYVVAVGPTKGCDAITKCEAWELFRDFLLLVAQRHFMGTLEALSLIVSPMVFEAVGQLFTYAQSGTGECLLHCVYANIDFELI